MLTIHQFNNEIRFLRDAAASDDKRSVGRCDLEPRLTMVSSVSSEHPVETGYYVDDVRVEDQSADGVVAALAMSNARAM